jgi:hypothetical protein
MQKEVYYPDNDADLKQETILYFVEGTQEHHHLSETKNLALARAVLVCPPQEERNQSILLLA